MRARKPEIDLRQFRPWFLKACTSHPRALKWLLWIAIALAFVLVGPAESLWRICQELGRAYRNFNFYRAKKVWLDLPKALREQGPYIESIRAAQAAQQSKEAQ